MQETVEAWVRSLGQEEPLEESMATLSTCLMHPTWDGDLFPPLIICDQ